VVNTTDGPLIRVGITYDTQPQVIISSSAYTLVNAAGVTLANLSASDQVTLDYVESSGQYSYAINSGTVYSTNYLRLVHPDMNGYFTVTTYEDRPGWNPSLNDNKFLGTIEVRYASATSRTWVINELPLEWYLKGIAETSNSSPMEYQKAMMVAARTYASYHLNKATKHANENFIVDAKFDQVYKGYGTMTRMPSVVQAVDATKGQIVTYAGEIAITPYFSWSDGHTRSMAEVWGVDKPWLQSVVEPVGYTKTTLYGHGVGLSAYGALILANDLGYTYDRILQYYYTGVSITANYNNLFN